MSNVSRRRFTFSSTERFQKLFSSQYLKQLFYVFNAGLTVIPHFTNIARRKGNVNFNFFKSDIMMTLFKY